MLYLFISVLCVFKAAAHYHQTQKQLVSLFSSYTDLKINWLFSFKTEEKQLLKNVAGG